MHSDEPHEIVELIASKYLQYVNAICGKSGTTLHLASHTSHLQLARLLLACGVDIDALGVRNQLLLQFGSFCGHVEVVQYLLDLGADAIFRDENQR
jgi:ankyrin repeat protein